MRMFSMPMIPRGCMPFSGKVNDRMTPSPSRTSTSSPALGREAGRGASARAGSAVGSGAGSSRGAVEVPDGVAPVPSVPGVFVGGVTGSIRLSGTCSRSSPTASSSMICRWPRKRSRAVVFLSGRPTSAGAPVLGVSSASRVIRMRYGVTISACGSVDAAR
ncbi:hypothetical protein APS67_005791 [Streptomyces sp. AVP053U2]|nr:hypothetical protein APS67_005791 [Streptomyces sp. AVP053U2]